MSNLLYTSADWDFDTLQRIIDAVEPIAHNELGLSTYPNQVEVISAEQMLDAYSSIGLPVLYKHWSFGKHFARDQKAYDAGMQGLAYEIVINSNPCISYNMEGNTATMMTLVIAHAAFGHNHFFKNNYMFTEWTDAEGIIDYLVFAKNYIQECEDKYGLEAVERILDDAHALMDHGVDRYKRKYHRRADEEKRREDRKQYEDSTWNPLWTTIPDSTKPTVSAEKEAAALKARLKLPEENFLYFLEKYSPRLKGWQREILRIVRKVAQYFYPQGQTKVMNEGCATYVHYEILTKLHERGMISDGNFLEFLKSHTNVVFQPGAEDRRFNGWNPYALGFGMMKDIERICMKPTEEDKEWFPSFAGNQQPYPTLVDAWANFRDESFILQFLSPEMIRKFRIFHVEDAEKHHMMEVKNIHDRDGYKELRAKLAKQHDQQYSTPEMTITDVDMLGDRRLEVTHTFRDERPLHHRTEKSCYKAMARLWGYPIMTREIDDKGSTRYASEVSA